MSKYASQLFKRVSFPVPVGFGSLGINCLPRAATWRKMRHQVSRPAGATPCNSPV